MAARIAGFAPHSNQTLQFQNAQLGRLPNRINGLGVVQGRLIRREIFVFAQVMLTPRHITLDIFDALNQKHIAGTQGIDIHGLVAEETGVLAPVELYELTWKHIVCPLLSR